MSSKEERNKSGIGGSHGQQPSVQGEDTFSTVQYSKQFQYLCVANYHGEHVQLTGIHFANKVQPYGIIFNQCIISISQQSSSEPTERQIIQSRKEIVEITGDNEEFLQRMCIFLPIFQTKVIEVVVRNQYEELRGVIATQSVQNVLQLYDKRGAIKNEMSYTMSFKAATQRREEEKAKQNMLFSFQKLNNTDNNESLQKISEEEGKSEVIEDNNKMQFLEVQGIRGQSQSSENQFIPVRSASKASQKQGAPQKSISKQFSFNMISGVDNSVLNQDDEQDVPIHQPPKSKLQLPSLLQQAIAHSMASRKNKNKIKNDPQSQMENEYNSQVSKSLISQNNSQRFTVREQGRQMQRYRELSQKKQLEKSREKQKESSNLKYDYKPIDTIQKSEHNETIGLREKNLQEPNLYKTPLEIKTEQKAQSNIRSLQATPQSKLRGFTDKIYLKRFLRGKNIQKNSEPQQKSEEKSQEKEKRKPGFIFSHRIKVDSLRKAIEIKESQPQTMISSFEDKKGKLSLPLEKLGKMKEEKKQSQNRSIKNESREKRVMPSNSRLQKISRSVSRQYDQTRKHNKQLKLNSNNFQCNISKTDKHLNFSRHIIDVQVGFSSNPNRSLQKVIDEKYIPQSQKRKVEEHSPEQSKNKNSIISKYQSNTSHIYPTDSQEVSNSKNFKLPRPVFKTISQYEKEQTQVSFDIIINNLSVNLYSKTFGRKFLELTLRQTLYTTDYLHGSHLLWVGRGYLFPGVSPEDSIQLCLKCEKDSYLKVMGKNKVKIKDLLINHRQSFYQSYLFTPSSELLSVVILGFEISTHRGERTNELPERYHGSKTTHKYEKKSRTLGKTRRQPLLGSFLDDHLEDKKDGEKLSRRGKDTRLITQPAFDSINLHEKGMATEMSHQREDLSDN